MRVSRCLALVALLVMLLATPAFASADSSAKVHDYADLFTADELSVMVPRIAAISGEFGFDILILTDALPGVLDLAAERYANEFYDNNRFGFGEHGDGVALFINIGNGMPGGRAVAFTTSGRCRPLYDPEIDSVLDSVYGSLSGGEYGAAAIAFLDDVGRIASKAGGLPESMRPSSSIPELLGTSAALGAGVAVIALVILIILHKRSMPNPPAYQTYLSGGVTVKRAEDVFLTTHTARVRIQRGGGGGGRSHGGGSRRF